jgi:hypothetical protein
MATTEDHDVPPHMQTVADALGNVWEEVAEAKEAATTSLLGRAGRPLWPVLAATAVVVLLMVQEPVAAFCGAILQCLVLVWMASHR